jgi:hypothetical protein
MRRLFSPLWRVLRLATRDDVAAAEAKVRALAGRVAELCAEVSRLEAALEALGPRVRIHRGPPQDPK